MLPKGRSKSRVRSSGRAVTLNVPTPTVSKGKATKSVAEYEDDASRPTEAVRRIRLRCTDQNNNNYITPIGQSMPKALAS